MSVAVLASAAWTAYAADGTPPSVQAERDRIAAERSRLAERSAEEQRGCHQKFAVNDCLDGARARQREALDDLRRQEVLLNDGERQRKAGEQVRKLDEKRRARDAEEGDRPATVPAPVPRSAPAPATGRLPRDAMPQAPDAAQIQRHQEAMRRKQDRRDADTERRAAQAGQAGEAATRHADKLKDAAEHKAKTLERNAAKASTAQPLPAP